MDKREFNKKEHVIDKPSGDKQRDLSKSQNQSHNIKREGLGPNAGRNQSK